MTIIDTGRDIYRSFRKAVPPIHREGHKFVLIAAIAAVVIGALINWLFWPLLALMVFVALFFRDPPRVVQTSDSLVLSPADGRISAITLEVPPTGTGLGVEPRLRISVFMSVFNCHINRVPVSGTVRAINYVPGSFVNTELDKASQQNERNGIVIDSLSEALGEVAVVQIAGLIARRIVCWTSEGDTVTAGDRFGLIRFGSRVDVYLPVDVKVCVSLGQTAIGGETVLAEVGTGDAEPPMTRIV